MSKQVSRLFEQFEPVNYNLSLTIDKKRLLFSGQVEIIGKKTGRPSRRITLHQKELKCKQVSLIRIEKSGQKELEIERINTHKSFDELRIHSKDLLHSGSYKIII